MMVRGEPPWILIILCPLLLARVGDARIRAAKDAADKPFSFCLPRYRESLRRASFLAALWVGLGVAPAAAVFLCALSRHSEELTAIKICLDLIAGFLLGMAGSLCLQGDLRFVVSRIAWGFVQVLAILVFVVLVIAVPALIEYLLLSIPPAVVVCVVMWGCLGEMARLKRGHRMILEDALDRQKFYWQKADPVQPRGTAPEGDWTQRVEEKTPETAFVEMESLFHRRMKRRGQSDTLRCIWGNLYGTFGHVGSYRMWILMSIIVAALIFGYAGRWFTQVVFVASGILALAAPLPMVFGGPWLPVGRRERCWATIALAAVVSLLLVGGIAVVALCTWVLSLFLSISEDSWYSGIHAIDICLPGLLVPWMFGWRLLRLRWPRLADAMASVTRIAWIAALLFLMFDSFFWLKPVGIGLFAAGWIVGWPFFLLVLRDACVRASLIEPESGEGDTE
jgi:hypothetical protein